MILCKHRGGRLACEAQAALLHKHIMLNSAQCVRPEIKTIHRTCATVHGHASRAHTKAMHRGAPIRPEFSNAHLRPVSRGAHTNAVFAAVQFPVDGSADGNHRVALEYLWFLCGVVTIPCPSSGQCHLLHSQSVQSASLTTFINRCIGRSYALQSSSVIRHFVDTAQHQTNQVAHG